MKKFDLIVIGGGSGGVRAARIAASHGANVAICEEYRYGGTCVIRGCVPKKLMVYASHFEEEFTDSKHYGWQVGDTRFNWQTLIDNKDQEIDRLNGIYESMLEKAGVTLFHGSAQFVDQNTVSINEQNLYGKKILVATGGTPFMPNIPGIEYAISSNEFFHLENQPKSALVVGGGYIAVELAGIFNGLGTQTTLSYRGEQLLRGFDQSIRTHLSQEIQNKGLELKLQSKVERIELIDQVKRVHFEDQSTADYDVVLYATGRTPNSNKLNLEATGVELGDKQQIKVNQYSQTNINSIYAVGDVTDRIALTPVATMEAHAFADTEFGNKPRLADHQNVPSAVFSQPPVATVGLTEEQAKQAFTNIDTYSSSFRTLKHSLTDNQERTLMKLVVDAQTDVVLGAHMVGSDAAEIMQGVTIAIKAGAKKSDFDATVGIHPSSAEEFCTMRNKD